MALPSGPIPLVAVGEIIEETWGDSVAQSLNNLTELYTHVAWGPDSGDEYLADNDGLMTTWFSFGGATPIELTIPDWATSAYAHFSIAGVQYEPDTAGRTSYLLRAKIGTLTTREVRFSGQGGWFGLSWGIHIADIEDITGAATVSIQAQRIENLGGADDQWKLFDQSDAAMWIIFKQPVDTYPGL